MVAPRVAWTIHIRKDERRFQHEAFGLSDALAVACLLMRDGIEVERIEGPDGMRITADAIRPLCDGLG